MSRVMRKSVFRVSDQVQHKPGCTAKEDGCRLEISGDCTIRVAKTKALISFAVTAKLICVFVFPYAKCWFSHDAAHLYFKHAFLTTKLNKKTELRVVRPKFYKFSMIVLACQKLLIFSVLL